MKMRDVLGFLGLLAATLFGVALVGGNLRFWPQHVLWAMGGIGIVGFFTACGADKNGIKYAIVAVLLGVILAHFILR